MEAKLSEFLGKRLLVVTGKGGAGKSLLALALAHRLAAEGKKVWLVEMGRPRDQVFSRLPSLVGKESLGHEPTDVELPGARTSVAVSVLDPTRSLGEYVDLKLPTGGLAGILLNNRVTASFLEVVPGLPDLVTLGKLWHVLAHPPNKGFRPDVVVLDAPATGHALALLAAPRNFRRITAVGPIFRDASRMEEFLRNEAETGIALVTLPEEMSIQETLETRATLAKEFVAPLVFVNKRFPKLPNIEPPKQKSLPWQAYDYAAKRAEREARACAELGRHRRVELPYLFPEPGAPSLYLRLAERLP